MDNTGCYINRFCLSWTILVGKSPCFVCREQYWLLYIPGLCAMNKTGWYITRFCPLLTIMVGISPSFFCRGQNWLVYQPVLSVVDKNSWYIKIYDTISASCNCYMHCSILNINIPTKTRDFQVLLYIKVILID